MKMDLNNKMILMRKDLRAARGMVIQKLVRKIRVLKSSKGNEQLRKKKLNHANNLSKEIDIIKSLTPDVIFKCLLSSDVTLPELGVRENVSLRERACVRVGMVPFINQRMSAIKAEVREFNTQRSGKEDIASLKIAKKLPMQVADTDPIRSKDSNQDEEESLAEQPNQDEEESLAEQPNQDEEESLAEQSDQDEEESLAEQSDLEENQPSRSKIPRLDDALASRQYRERASSQPRTPPSGDIPSNVNESEKKTRVIATESESIPCKPSVHSITDENRCLKAEEEKSTLQDDDEITSGDGSEEEYRSLDLASDSSDGDGDVHTDAIQVVLPEFYAKKSDVKQETNNTIKNEPALTEQAEDFLKVNAGAGYADSDEEAEAVRVKRWSKLNLEEEDNDEDFFLSEEKLRFERPHSTAKPAVFANMSDQLKRVLETNPISTERLVPRGRGRYQRSTLRGRGFGRLESNEWSRYPKSKNNPVKRGSSRTRGANATHSFPPPVQSVPVDHRPSQEKSKKKTVETGTNATNLHPSWMASKKKKEQNRIHQFAGTHIRFDD